MQGKSLHYRDYRRKFNPATRNRQQHDTTRRQEAEAEAAAAQLILFVPLSSCSLMLCARSRVSTNVKPLSSCVRSSEGLACLPRPDLPRRSSRLASSRMASHGGCAPVSLVCLLVSLSLLSPSPSSPQSVCLPSGHANKIAENPQPTKVLTNAFGLRWRRWHLSRFVRDSEAICARFARLSKLSASKVSFVQGGEGAGQVSTEIKQKGLPNAISYLGAWQANITEAAAVAAVAFELSNSRRMMSH